MKKFKFGALGADPEVFLKDKDGKPYSAEGLFGGTKLAPVPMGIGDGFFIQEDNVAAEYNIPPCSNARDFANSILRGLSYINKVAKRNNLQLALEAALNFDPTQLATPHAQMLGCEPDYNIWTLSINPRPVPPATLRTAAGHLHASWQTPDEDQKVALVRALDITLGVPSILVTKMNERRSLYGRAGAFRDKPYGVEYRTLDNFWLGSRKYAIHVFNQVIETMDQINTEGAMFLDELEDRSEEIQATINNHDKDNAIKLMNYFQVQPFPA